VTFPEAYLPGYPEYIWRLLPGADYDLSRELHGRLVANAVDLASDDLLPIREAARRHGIVVITGIHERDAAFSRAADRFYPDPDEWLNPGDSVIVAPGGAVVAGPLHAEHGILYADCDPAAADAGHYNRPDIFSLTVQRAA
jgi:predicted amidohydrolase